MSWNFAVIIPMANEEKDFHPFVDALTEVLDSIGSGRVYFVVDLVSKDDTLQICRLKSKQDARFSTIWAPENKNVVDAYLCGYRNALENKHDFIIEMDAGMSHDPSALTMFLRVLNEGNECAFGSRFINGGSVFESTWKRTFLSKAGTHLANLFLGTHMYDMTSGFQGFHTSVVEKFLKYELLSRAHFYQTELRYLLRKTRYAEIPIHYRAPSPSVSKKSVSNALRVLFHYFVLRLSGKAPSIT